MASNHLILGHPLLLQPSIFPNIRVFSNESALCIRWPKDWSFNFSISPSSEHSGLISRMDWLDLLAIQETLKSLLQHHSSKHPFFSTQLSSLPNNQRDLNWCPSVSFWELQGRRAGSGTPGLGWGRAREGPLAGGAPLSQDTCSILQPGSSLPGVPTWQVQGSGTDGPQTPLRGAQSLAAQTEHGPQGSSISWELLETQAPVPPLRVPYAFFRVCRKLETLTPNHSKITDDSLSEGLCQTDGRPCAHKQCIPRADRPDQEH